jgi:hypothetical protein
LAFISIPFERLMIDGQELTEYVAARIRVIE